MKKRVQFVVMLSMVFGLFSCSMVKQPQSANFQTVKYNSHLNLAKKHKTKKMEPTVESFEKTANIEKRSTPIETVARNHNFKNLLTASTSKQHAVKADELEVNQMEEQLKVDDEKAHTIFNRAHRLNPSSAINDYLAKPMPVASDAPLGNILYVVLVVILILIVISLFADLAGGLIGALIAVLLILLVLRLLGLI